MKPYLFIFSIVVLMNAQVLQAQDSDITLQWKIAGELPAINGHRQSLGFAGPVAGVHNDVLIVAGGANFPDSMPWEGGQKRYYSDGYLFKRQDDSLAFFQSFQLPFSVAYSANCSLPQGVIMAGGENEEGFSNKVFLIQCQPSFAAVRIDSLPSLPVAVSNASIASDGRLIFLAGGEFKEGASNRFFCLDMLDLSAGWKELPLLIKPVSHALLAVSGNGEKQGLFLIGGRKKNNGSTSELYGTVYRYDLAARAWQEKTPLPYSLSAHSGIASGANKILLFGGDKGDIFHQLEKLNAVIALEENIVQKRTMNARKLELLSGHPGFSNEVLLYCAESGKWLAYGKIPFHVPVTTTAIKWRDDIIIPGGEIKPGLRTPALLIGKQIKQDPEKHEVETLK